MTVAQGSENINGVLTSAPLEQLAMGAMIGVAASQQH